MDRGYSLLIFTDAESLGVTPGGYSMPRRGPLTDGVGSVLDREVYFPLAGYAGPGFHTWPSGHIHQDNGFETASPHPAPCQKDVRRDVRRRDRGQRPTATEKPWRTRHTNPIGGNALAYRMAPRWALGRGQGSAIGGSVIF